MSASSCQHFDGCNSSLCPLDPASLAHCAWFRDEDICKRQDYQLTPMVHRQKRIGRATGKDFERGCFTAEMLARVTKITRSIKGLDPGAPITLERTKKWLEGFKGRKILTEEQRAVLRARALKMMAQRNTRRPWSLSE